MGGTDSDHFRGPMWQDNRYLADLSVGFPGRRALTFPTRIPARCIMAISQPVGGRRFLGRELPRVSDGSILTVVAVLGLASVARTLPTYPALTLFRPEALRALPNVMAPLVLLALFVERGVEVLLAGWRAGGARTMDAEVGLAKDKGDMDAKWSAKRQRDAYAADSQRLAFLVAFFLSLLISMMGVRAIEMLVGPTVVADAPTVQQRLFVRVDILVTALLLTGGAEGIHKVVNAFTTYMETTREKMK